MKSTCSFLATQFKLVIAVEKQLQRAGRKDGGKEKSTSEEMLSSVDPTHTTTRKAPLHQLLLITVKGRRRLIARRNNSLTDGYER